MLLQIKKSLFILGNFKKRLPLMFFLFLCVSMIDVIGIGMIGPFVALVGHKGIIVNDYPIFFSLLGNVGNSFIIIFFGVLLSSIFIVKGFVAFFVQKKILSLGYEIRASIVEKLVNSYQKSSYEDISNKDSSTVVVNANTHVGLFIDSVFIPALKMSIEIIVIIGIFMLMAFTSFLLVLVAVILMTIVLSVYYKFIRARLSYYGEIMSNREASIISELQNVIGTFREIRLLGVEKFFRNEIKNDVIEFGKAGVITRSLHLISRYVIESSLVVFVVALVILMISQSKSIESIYALLSVFAVGSLRLVPSFNAIGLGLANIKTASYAMNSLFDEIIDINEINKKSIDINPTFLIDFESLELKNISYSYKTNENSKVLKDINLYIKKGNFVAILGKSGTGKSTLIDIMTGMLQPTSGSFFVNNFKVMEKLSIESWQKKCAFIPQSIFLINSSIKKNIALGLDDIDIDNEKLQLAISGANLNSVLFQNSMDIDSSVGERGLRLSGGQRQRVAIARALYAGREVIFMDEVTSALDKETEDDVMTHISSLRGKITIILITHSQSALKNCDQVFKMVNGTITTN